MMVMVMGMMVMVMVMMVMMMMMMLMMMMMMMVEEVVIEIDKEKTCLRRAIPPLMSSFACFCSTHDWKKECGLLASNTGQGLAKSLRYACRTQLNHILVHRHKQQDGGMHCLDAPCVGIEILSTPSVVSQRNSNHSAVNAWTLASRRHVFVQWDHEKPLLFSPENVGHLL